MPFCGISVLYIYIYYICLLYYTKTSKLLWIKNIGASVYIIYLSIINDYETHTSEHILQNLVWYNTKQIN